MRPTIAWQCPKRWTPEDEEDLREHLAELCEEVESAGGPGSWIQSCLIPSLARPAAPCPTPRLHARRVRREQHA
ncbi:MAG TPA: hypothetical protein VGB52_12465 [Actinomycetota bacterium]|jgi:hypothetical protein